MNDFDIGPSTISRVEVDEEPPGSPCQSHSLSQSFAGSTASLAADSS